MCLPFVFLVWNGFLVLGQVLWVWSEVFGVNVDGFGFFCAVGDNSCVVRMVGFLGGAKNNVTVVRVVCPVAVEFALLLWSVIIKRFHGFR